MSVIIIIVLILESLRIFMANTNDLLNRINHNYSVMSKGQKLLATYITDNYDKAVFLTAAKMGDIVGVSESTVVRFAMSLGYISHFFDTLTGDRNMMIWTIWHTYSSK